MKRCFLILAASAVAMTACGRLPQRISTPAAPPPEIPATSTRIPVVMPERVVISSSSLSLTVEDPAEALAALEALVAQAGGFVSSSSVWSDTQQGYASMSAEVPPQALAELRQSAIELAQSVDSNSTYSQDVTFEVQALYDRIALIDGTEHRLLEILLGTDDPSLAESYVVVAELFRQERETAESQLRNYLQSSSLSSFDVNLNRTPAVLRQLMEPTPTPPPNS
jgi:hypothetical protein